MPTVPDQRSRPPTDLSATLTGLLHAVAGDPTQELVRATSEWIVAATGAWCWFEPAGPRAEAVIGRARRRDQAVDLEEWQQEGPGRLAGVPLFSGRTHVGTMFLWGDEARAWTSEELRDVSRAGLWLGVSLQVTSQPKAERAPRHDDVLRDLRGDLITLVSHELRTPLSVIRAGLELLVDEDLGPITPDQRLMLERMEKSMHRLVGIADNATRIAPSSRRDSRPVTEPTDVHEMLRSVVRAGSSRGRSSIELEASETPVFTSVPESDVRGIVRRLIDNAVTVVSEGGHVWVSATGGVENVTIEVLDDGPGIPTEEQAALGTPFVKTSASVRAEHPGPGLGLAAARRTAEEWGGRIVLESGPGHGTRVRVLLPVAVPAQAEGVGSKR